MLWWYMVSTDILVVDNETVEKSAISWGYEQANRHFEYPMVNSKFYFQLEDS